MFGHTLAPVVAVEDRDAAAIGEGLLLGVDVEVVDIGVGTAAFGTVGAQLGEIFEPRGVFVPPADPGLVTGMIFLIEEAGQLATDQVHLGAFEQSLHRLIQITAVIGGTNELFDSGESVTAQLGDDDLHRRFVPAGMHHAQLVEIKPEWQCPEPFQIVLLLGIGQLVQECLVLIIVPGAVRPQVLTAAGGMLNGIGEGVELVVAHDDQGGAGIDHGLHQLQRPQLFGSAVDEIADEDGCAFGMCVGAGLGVDAVVEAFQPFFQQSCHAVDVADDVVSPHDLIVSRGCDSN